MSEKTEQPAGGADAIRTIELDWFDEEEVVAVNPRDQKRFEVQKDRAIEILRLAESQVEQFQNQLELLFEILANWVDAHASDVERAFLTMQDGTFSLVVVKKSARYDAELEEALSDLDFEIAQDKDLDLIRLNATSLPPVSPAALSAFVDEGFLLSYDGQRKRSHQPGEREPRDAPVSPRRG